MKITEHLKHTFYEFQNNIDFLILYLIQKINLIQFQKLYFYASKTQNIPLLFLLDLSILYEVNITLKINIIVKSYFHIFMIFLIF